MPFDFTFKSVQTTDQIRQTRDFLLKQDLKYPRYDEWVAKVESELLSGYKRAALAYSNGVLVGDIVWQYHKQLPRVKELKNLRVHPKASGRYIAQFLIRQAEIEDKRKIEAIIGDARENQFGLIALMQSMGYSIISKLPLYEESQKDVILLKASDKKLQQGIITKANDFLRL